MTLTLRGRLQTKLLTYIILAAVTCVFTGMYGTSLFLVFMIAMTVGLLLETLWGLITRHQPGFFAFLFAAVEFMAILVVSLLLRIPTPLPVAAAYYFTAWSLIQLFLLYLLPVWRISWVEDSGELW